MQKKKENPKCPLVQLVGNKSEKSEHEMKSLLALSATPRLSPVCPENLLPRAKQCAGSWLQASLDSNNTLSLKHFILAPPPPQKKKKTGWQLWKWPRTRYCLFVL